MTTGLPAAVPPVPSHITTAVEAEMAVIGAYFVTPSVLRDIAGVLKPEHFASEDLGRVHATALKMLDDGRIANPVTLAPAGFDQRFLSNIAESATTPSSAREYARLIRDLWLKRALSAKCLEIRDKIEIGGVDHTADAIRSELEGWIFDTFSSSSGQNDARHVKEYADAALATAESAYKSGGVAGMTTGLIDIDRTLGGLFPGDFTVIAARPAMGKTAMGLGLARACASAGKPALVFSLEMPGEQLALREMAAQSGATVSDVRAGRISADQFDKMMVTARDLGKFPILVSSKPYLDMGVIASECARVKRRHGLGLVLVDYLQLISADGHGDNRVWEISYISRRLKALAIEMNCPVVALSQLSRAVEQRDDKRPHLSDLRESGSIEQDADIVWFLYRHAYYLAREEPRMGASDTDDKYSTKLADWRAMMAENENVAEVIIAKNRHGPTHTIRVHWNGTQMRFSNRHHQIEKQETPLL